MTSIVCSSNNIKIYKNVLNNTYKKRKISYYDLKSCIKHKWKNVKFVDIVVQDNQFNLQICCDDNIISNARKALLKGNHRNNLNKTNIDSGDFDVSFVQVARELNEWHIGTFILEKINTLSNGYDYDMSVVSNNSIIIPLGVPISRIIEFYGVRGV